MSNSKHDDSKGTPATEAKKGHIELTEEDLGKVSGGTKPAVNSSHGPVGNNKTGAGNNKVGNGTN